MFRYPRVTNRPNNRFWFLKSLLWGQLSPVTAIMHWDNGRRLISSSFVFAHQPAILTILRFLSHSTSDSPPDLLLGNLALRGWQFWDIDEKCGMAIQLRFAFNRWRIWEECLKTLPWYICWGWNEREKQSHFRTTRPGALHWLCVPLISRRHLVEANQTLEVSPRSPGNGAGLAIRWNEVEEGN